MPGSAEALVKPERSCVVVAEERPSGGPDKSKIPDVAIRLEQIIEDKKIRDWTTNLDVQNEIKLAIEDYLYSVKLIKVPNRETT
jgi:hypothetical protein